MIDSKTPKLRLLTRSDLEDIELEPSLVIRAVEDGYLAFAEGSSQCPTKMMIDLPVESRDSIAFSMLGFDANRDLVGYKTSYRHGSDNPDKYYTTISLYDDESGMPYALMDCQKVGASRTPATTSSTMESKLAMSRHSPRPECWLGNMGSWLEAQQVLQSTKVCVIYTSFRQEQQWSSLFVMLVRNISTQFLILIGFRKIICIQKLWSVKFRECSEPMVILVPLLVPSRWPGDKSSSCNWPANRVLP